MMSGVELNALMTQLQASQAQAETQADSQGVIKAEKSAKSYNNYNREIWRVQGGILESSLVDFCVQRTRSKFIDDITSKRKPNLTLFKEDWLDLIDTLKRIISDIIEKGDPRSEWLKTVTITHQLCAQKYRNLKKVYHISKQKDSRKFSYKREFKELEDLSSTVLQESTKVLTASSQLINEASLKLVPALTVPDPLNRPENGMSEPSVPSPVKIERREEPEIGVEEILVTEDERMESPDSSYTSPTHLQDESLEPKTEPSEPMPTSRVPSVQNLIPLVGAEELIARLGQFLGDQKQDNKKVKLVSTKSDVSLSQPVKAALSGIVVDTKPTLQTNGQSLNGVSNGISQIEKMLLKVTCMMDSWHRESREHQMRMERIMLERVRASEESNRLQKEKIALEREKFEFMKLRRTIEEMHSSESEPPASTNEPVGDNDEKPLLETDPDDIPLIQSVEKE